jgi:hypothetical protein
MNYILMQNNIYNFVYKDGYFQGNPNRKHKLMSIVLPLRDILKMTGAAGTKSCK